jgi:hypothetical protein
MAEHDTDPFTTRTRELLDEQTDHLDADTLWALKRARSRALQTGRRDRTWFFTLPAGALAAGLLAGVTYLNRIEPTPPDYYPDPLEQSVVENMELMNDMEFVAWLVMEEST